MKEEELDFEPPKTLESMEESASGAWFSLQ
jgi:hypothetical protein